MNDHSVQNRGDFNLIHLPQCSSTQDEGLKLVAQNQTLKPTLIWADTQTAGRGRQQRSWLSPQGGLYFSLVFTLRQNQTLAYQTNLLAGWSLLQTLRDLFFLPHDVYLKWPNDLVYKQKKLAGLLLQPSDQPNHFVLGVGLNINHAPILDESSLYQSVSLNDFLPNPFSPERILHEFAKTFLEKISSFEQNGLKSFLPFLRHEICKTSPSYKLKVEDNKQQTIKILDLDENGFLIALYDEGCIKTHYAEDLLF